MKNMNFLFDTKEIEVRWFDSIAYWKVSKLKSWVPIKNGHLFVEKT